MKHLSILFTFLMVLCFSAISQPAFNPVAKGNRQAGFQVMLAPTDMFQSETVLSINKDRTNYGLMAAANYGWFVEKGWMIGVQLNGGFYRYTADYQSNYIQDDRAYDFSIAPMTRYYFQVDKKHRFKPFLLAGVPVIYSNRSIHYTQSSGSLPQVEDYLELRGSFGFGAGYFGKAGNIEMHLSNMGFYLQLNKFFQGKNKK